MSYSQESERHVPPDFDAAVFPPSVMASEAAMYIFKDALQVAQDAAAELLHLGIPLEDVRYLYPQAVPTRIIVTARFCRWGHFLKLRRAAAAQWEIRAVAEEIARLLHAAAPEVF